MIWQLPLLPASTAPAWPHTPAVVHTWACLRVAAALRQHDRQALPRNAAKGRRKAGREKAAATCIAEVALPKAGFAGVKSEAEFMAVLEAGVAASLIPKPLLPGFVDFYSNYKGMFCVRHRAMVTQAGTLRNCV